MNKWADDIQFKTYKKLGWVVDKIERLIDQIEVQMGYDSEVDLVGIYTMILFVIVMLKIFSNFIFLSYCVVST